MGLLFGLAVGLFAGVAIMASWSYAMKRRSEQRILKAMHHSFLNGVGQDELKRLCNDSFPTWLSFPIFERVKWLNRQLERLWPYVAQATSDVIRSSVEPVLEEYCPLGITSLKFTKLFLGNVAPQIEGIRLQSFKELTMDLDFHWAGDPRIILSVHTLVGANLPIELKNMKFFATVRVIFQLEDGIPCISGFVVALLAKPQHVIKYTLKVIGGSLSAVPGLSDMIKETVETAVSDKLQWPHRILVTIAQHPVDLSDLERKLEGKLTVTIKGAKSLKNMEMIGKSDPYVEVYVRVIFKFRTKVIKNNLNPEWNETFELDVEDRETQALVLKVFDEDIGHDKSLGVVAYPVANLKPEETVELTLILLTSLDIENVRNTKDHGSIIATVKYHVYTKEEQTVAMEKEKTLLAAKKKAKEEGLINRTTDAIGGAVGSAGKLVGTGVDMVGSGVGIVGTRIGKAGKFMTRSFTGIGSKKARRPSSTPSIPSSPK